MYYFTCFYVLINYIFWLQFLPINNGKFLQNFYSSLIWIVTRTCACKKKKETVMGMQLWLSFQKARIIFFENSEFRQICNVQVIVISPAKPFFFTYHSQVHIQIHNPHADTDTKFHFSPIVSMNYGAISVQL